MSTVRWNVAVSADTDQSLRVFLAQRGGGKKGDLSKFIEEAVKARILELTASQVKKQNESVTEDSINQLVDEAMEWVNKDL